MASKHVASRSCSYMWHLTSATLSHNSHKQPRQPSSIALLFSFLLLHWLRSTRDPRRHTRLGSTGLQHTIHRTTPPEGERERERRTWRAGLHSHSNGKYEDDDFSIAEASPATCESDPMFGMSFANVNIERIFLYYHYEFVKRDVG